MNGVPRLLRIEIIALLVSGARGDKKATTSNLGATCCGCIRTLCMKLAQLVSRGLDPPPRAPSHAKPISIQSNLGYRDCIIGETR